MPSRSLFAAIGNAFITGRPNMRRTVSTRSGDSVPCNCSISGCNASTTASSRASSASTVSATFCARSSTRDASACALSKATCRGDGAKNTKPTMSVPASSATSRASAVARPQILTMTDMPARSRSRLSLTGALLHPHAGFVLLATTASLLERRPQLKPFWRLAGLRHARAAARGVAERSELAAQLADVALEAPRGTPQIAVPQPRCRAADQHADNQQPDDKNEQRQVERGRRMLRAERVERHRDHLPVGHGEGDDDDGERYEDDGRNELAEHAAGRSRFAGQPALERLSRSRISLPVLKNGTHFWSTATWAPVRGLR